MNAGWKTVKLNDVCDIVKGRKPNLRATPNKGDLPYLVARYIRGLEDPEYGSATEKGVVTLTEADTVIICDGSNSGEIFTGLNGIMSSTMGKVVKKTEIYDPYLRHFLSSTFELFNGTKTGSAIPHLDKDAFRKLEIPLPPLAEQKRIVALLDEAFAGIDEAKAKAESNLQCAENLFKTHLTTVFTKRTHGWNEKSIYEVCERLHQGLNTAGEKVQFSDSGYPIIQTRNIEGGKIDIDNKMKYMSEADWQLYKEKYRPEIGDVFFTNIGTIGKTAIVTVERDYLIHWNIFKLRPLPGEITPEFLRYSLEQLTLSGYFEKMQKGGTVSFVTKKMISEAQIMAPNIVEQKAVTNILDELRIETKALASLYNHKLIELAKLKNSLLSQAFAGELTA